MKKTNVLITGGSGLLASNIALLKRKDWNIKLLTRNHIVKLRDVSAESCSLEDVKSIITVIEEFKPEVVIHSAGLTNVDLCEKKKYSSYLANVLIAKNVAEACSGFKSLKLVHISTDHLYDKIGFSSESNINLVNTYARTKFLGEQVCTAPRSLIIRTNFFGKSKLPGRKSLSDWIIEKLEAGEKVRAFNDVYFNPLSIETLVKLIKISVIKDLKGIYNVSSKNGLSKYDFAKTLAKEMNYNPNQIESISIDQHLNLGAKRPKSMMMDCTKFEAATNLSMPELAVEIKIAANGYQL